jgi:hypothetical protein
MERPLFDKETNMFLLDEYVCQMNSYKKIMEDGIVTNEEILIQTQRVIEKLKKLDEILSDDAKEILTDALGEIAVLYAASRLS